MSRRFEGTLTQWNDDRGFGFVAPAQGGQAVFVHISAFPRDGQRPQPHEALSFEIELDNKGKKRAVGVRRPAGSQPAPRRLTPGGAVLGRPVRHATGGLAKWVAMLLLVAVGVYGYDQYSKRVSAYPSADTGQPLAQPVGQEPVQVLQPTAVSFRCDGRQHCSQMTSCAEATFFLKNCPGVKMDGDGDGVPCEEQWCSRP
ncbi:MAG: excalibur calcium-binding domain-containing protein [Pseudomonadota bacterium]|nr:excalibur calcium-binding domain-containing protein [Pseudomonadota bacterium]